MLLLGFNLIVQQVEHTLHRLRHRITLRKFVVLEQSLEHGTGYDMLREHLDNILLRKSGIDVAAQTAHKRIEGSAMLAVIGYEILDTLDMLFGNLCNVPRPLFPIAFGAYFLHHLGIEYVLQVVERHLELPRHSRRCTVGIGLAVTGRFGTVVAILATYAHTAEENVFRFALGEFDFVDFGIETVVMRTQCVKDRPHNLEIGVLLQNYFALGIGRHNDGYNYVAILLALAAAHNSTYRLHNIDLRVLGRHEHHSVQRRHIDTLAQTTGIGQHTALHIIVGLTFEPHQFLIATGSRHRPVHMVGNHIDHGGLFRFENILHIEVFTLGKHLRHRLRGFYR